MPFYLFLLIFLPRRNEMILHWRIRQTVPCSRSMCKLERNPYRSGGTFQQLAHTASTHTHPSAHVPDIGLTVAIVTFNHMLTCQVGKQDLITCTYNGLYKYNASQVDTGTCTVPTCTQGPSWSRGFVKPVPDQKRCWMHAGR